MQLDMSTISDVPTRRRAPRGPAVEEQEFLSAYDARKFPPVAVTVDIAILAVRAGELCVLLVRRGMHPYLGQWALPGGFVRDTEDLDTAAERELREETGVVARAHLEQLRCYGAPGRDPRMRVVSVAYLALVADLPGPVADTDAAEARFWSLAKLGDGRPPLAFDHRRILDDAVERARAKLEYTSLATTLVSEPFTIGDLRRVYEAVWGVALHPANFRRKVLATPGFVEPTGDRCPTGRGWTELYVPGATAQLHPALLRPAPRGEADPASPR
jgi:8-oxo-dGTP diphosphatase